MATSRIFDAGPLKVQVHRASSQPLETESGDLLIQRVARERWGEGTIQRYDRDQVTVLFDDHGYRDLLVSIVLERELLRIL